MKRRKRGFLKNPIRLQVGDNVVGITFESLVWFLAFTAIGTVMGGVLYAYLAPYLPTVPGSSLTPALPPVAAGTNPTQV